MYFPGFLSSLLNQPLGILGAVFHCTRTRFILPYEASLTFRNPFCFGLPPHLASRHMQLPSEGPKADFHRLAHSHVQRTVSSSRVSAHHH